VARSNIEIETVVFLPSRFDNNPILASIALYSLLTNVLPIPGKLTKIRLRLTSITGYSSSSRS